MRITFVEDKNTTSITDPVIKSRRYWLAEDKCPYCGVYASSLSRHLEETKDEIHIIASIQDE